MHWNDIPGWFQWRSAQEEAAHRFPEGSRFVEVGNFLGRSLCSLGEVVKQSGKRFTVIGVDTCRGSGVEGPRGKDYHGAAVAEGGGTFAGTLHRNVIECGYGDLISLIVADSVTASTFFADRSIDWVHLDARHDREHVKADIARVAAEGQGRRLAVGRRLRRDQVARGRERGRRAAAGGAALVDRPVALDAPVSERPA